MDGSPQWFGFPLRRLCPANAYQPIIKNLTNANHGIHPTISWSNDNSGFTGSRFLRILIILATAIPSVPQSGSE